MKTFQKLILKKIIPHLILELEWQKENLDKYQKATLL